MYDTDAGKPKLTYHKVRAEGGYADTRKILISPKDISHMDKDVSYQLGKSLCPLSIGEKSFLYIFLFLSIG